MIEIRIVKVIIVGSLAVFAFLVTFDNITDYSSNFEFVQHVLSMDTIFPGSALSYRRVTSPALWHAAYIVIILGEGLTAMAPAGSAAVLLRHLRSPALRSPSACEEGDFSFAQAGQRRDPGSEIDRIRSMSVYCAIDGRTLKIGRIGHAARVQAVHSAR